MRRSHRSLTAIFALALGFWSCQSDPNVSSSDTESALECIQPAAIRAHIRYLSDDLLEGREAGTRGYDLAAKYVATTLESMNLEPAGAQGTYFQNVPLRSSVVDYEESSLTLFREGWEKRLRIGEDYILSPDYDREKVQLQAPLIFVGYGITAPELDHDDYAGVDADGKIGVVLYGAPATFPHDERAYYSGSPKVENAIAHGVVGILTIIPPADAKRIPWSMIARRAKQPRMRWIDASGHPNAGWPEIRGAALLSHEVAAEIFTYAPASLDDAVAAAESDEARSFDIPIEAAMVTVSRLGDVQSPNVVAKLPGSDPELRDEYVVYSAHLDHDGVIESVEGDNIFNGAYDNAAGTAAMLELARAFQCLPEPPRRSILFLGTTAEEKGLLGADYFAEVPTVPRESIVADLNIDEPLMLYPIKDVIVYGGEHSSLGDTFQRAADHLDLSVSPDPMPEEVIFVRSDQFPFVRQGIPAAYTTVGWESGDPEIDGKAATQTWMTTIYHTPKDDFSQEMDFQTGVIYTRLNFLAGYLVAQSTERPTWNEGDFFGTRFAGKQEAHQ